MFGYSIADICRFIFMALLIIDCIALTIMILMQESKDPGLSGVIAGAGESYWGKIKGRTLEGNLVKFTTIGLVVFLVLGLVLDMNF
ncbi:MAG: preprotein translocase subunit SecG [Lachnospiraceae bacterium]